MHRMKEITVPVPLVLAFLAVGGGPVSGSGDPFNFLANIVLLDCFGCDKSNRVGFGSDNNGFGIVNSRERGSEQSGSESLGSEMVPARGAPGPYKRSRILR